MQWVPRDLPPAATVVQIPKRLQTAWVDAKMHVMKAALAARGEATNEWTALLQFDQLMLAAPGDKHKAEGMMSMAPVLERRLHWFWHGE